MDYLFSLSLSLHVLYDDGDIYWYNNESYKLALFGRYNNYEVISLQLQIETYKIVDISCIKIFENLSSITNEEFNKIIEKYILLKIIEKLS